MRVIAYVNSVWLDRDKRKERIDIIYTLIDEYVALAECGNISANEIKQWETLTEELNKLERVDRAEFDVLFFAYEYFSETFNPENPDNLIPAGNDYIDVARFHVELCSLLNDVAQGKYKNNVAWSVGRGHAKTAYLSNIFLCHQVVFRHRRYIVEVSETTDVAGDFIQWTAGQLKYNQKLRNDFGVLLYEKKTMNTVDNKHEFVTTSNTKVEAKGIQTQMRGLRHGATRPDLFLLDDLESRDNTNTPELREKNKRWFKEEMIPALSRAGIAVYMGTIVHYDSVLNYVINQRRDFVSRKFPAILSWAEREDLWDEWRRLYRQDVPDAREQARQFYYKHEDEMLKGTEVLWEGYFNYLTLLEIREDNGAKAFNQEYLGNPIDEETQIFKPEEFVFFTDEEIADLPLEYFMGLDFAMGKEKGDYSAIITLAKNRNTGICYVVDAFVERVHPDVLLEKAVSLTMYYQYSRIGIETQQAQEWFSDKLKAELQKRDYPAHTRFKEIKQRMRKALRIESLLPDIQTGKIRFRQEGKGNRLLLEMLELYPNHNHDDAPDALHMAFTASREGKKAITNKPLWL